MSKDECRKSGMTWKTGKSGGPGEAALRIANAVEQEKALHGPSDEKMKKVAEQAEYNSRTQAAVARIGGWCISVIEGTGDALLLFGQNLRCLLTLSYKKTKATEQLFQIGVLSMPIVAIALFFTGMVMAVHVAQALGKFGADLQLAQIVLVSIIRELSPIFTALLLAGLLVVAGGSSVAPLIYALF